MGSLFHVKKKSQTLVDSQIFEGKAGFRLDGYPRLTRTPRHTYSIQVHITTNMHHLSSLSIAGQRDVHTLGSNNTINQITGDQHNHYTTVQVESPSRSSSDSSTSLSFIDAPLDLLSIHFMGREQDLIHIREVLETNHGDIPTRCIIQGMHGLGKSQLALRFAKLSFDQHDYSPVFWISANTVEKLNQGFVNLFNLVQNPNRDQTEPSARLTMARRWLEESESKWLLVLDNVDGSTLGFIRDHLPRKNSRGKILFTTRAVTVATNLARSAGHQHGVLELKLPEVREAVHLLLTESGIDVNSANTREAEEVVEHVGRLPLAVSNAASFMKQAHKSLGDLLLLFKSEPIRVCSYSISFSTFPFSDNPKVHQVGQ
jgi:hypothetical protein